MDALEYHKLDGVDDRMWWFRGLHANLIAAGERQPVRSTGTRPASRRMLDAGCGTGGFLARLARAFPDAAILGIDMASQAARAARAKSSRPVCVGSVNALPIADGSLTAIFSADVLCHGGVDEAGTLAEFHRCLEPGGSVVLNLPAYPWLLSGHDIAVDNVRRYTASSARGLLEAAGFSSIRTTYWNMFLFPLMVLRRKIGSTAAPQSDVQLYPAPIEALFGFVLAIETFLLRVGLRLPFGGSLLAVAVKT